MLQQSSYSLSRLLNERAQDLRHQAADQAVASAVAADRRRARRESALAAIRAAAAAKEERAVFSWQNQRRVLGLRGFRSAR